MFRLYPNKSQRRTLEETLETCRRLYNDLLSDRISNLSGYFEQNRSLPSRKEDNKFLKQVYAQVLQDVVWRLDRVFREFRCGLSKHPRFKRNRRYNSFTYPQMGFKFEHNHVILSKIGRIKIRPLRSLNGILARATVIRDIDQWFIALLVKESPIRRTCGEGAIGVDLGISNLATLSNGTSVRQPVHLRTSAQRILSLQRSLSRKKRGSENREKARIHLAKAWRTLRRQRKDFIEKVSDDLTRSNRTIVFEKLSVGRMAKNQNLARAIMESGWGMLRDLTASKAERRGGRVILVDPSYTSQKCSMCGEVVHKTLQERVHKCGHCGLVMDRDVNAAKNILAKGLERAHAEDESLLVRHHRTSIFSH